jgi:hypothetical protein
MSATSADSQADGATSRETPIDVPPILRLPVELRDIIYDYATTRPEWLPFYQKNSTPRPLKDLTPQPQAFLMVNSSDSDAPWLTYHPLSRVSKQLRAELSTFLHTTSMPVMARVRNLDFSHVIHFLSGLEEDLQNAFKVGLDGNSKRKLTIELQGPYTVSCINTLPCWIEFVHSFVGPGKRAEIAALYKTVPTFPDGESDRWSRVPIPAMMDVQQAIEHCAPGGGKIEADKTVQTLYCRFRAETSYHRPTWDDIVEVVRRKVVVWTWLGYQ